jgi:hypothetical protein
MTARSALSILVLGCALGCHRDAASSSTPAPSSRASSEVGADRWLKGQLHAHTSDGSGDSDTPAPRAVAWYARHGFDFVVLTDHNHVTHVGAPDGLLVLPGVELTQNLATCSPLPRPGERCLLHMNALFATRDDVAHFPRPEPSATRRELFGRALDASNELGAVAQLNHPNFHGAADVELVVALASRGLALLEVDNQSEGCDNEGGPGKPSTEALWDQALARGAHLFATATGDAHDYEEPPGATSTGDRGFVMVRAPRDANAIRSAIERGDFYATTGVRFERVERTEHTLAARTEVDATLEVIADGRVVSRTIGREISVDPSAFQAHAVRLRAEANGKHALAQPVFFTRSDPPRGP